MSEQPRVDFPPGSRADALLRELDIGWSPALAKTLAPDYQRVRTVVPELEWMQAAPYIFAIRTLKRQHNATILAHNYQTPNQTHPCLLYTSPSPRDS